ERLLSAARRAFFRREELSPQSQQRDPAGRHRRSLQNVWRGLDGETLRPLFAPDSGLPLRLAGGFGEALSEGGARGAALRHQLPLAAERIEPDPRPTEGSQGCGRASTRRRRAWFGC